MELAHANGGDDVSDMQDMLDSMRRQAMFHANAAFGDTAIPRVALGMMTETTSGVATIYEPVTCLILQGAKQVTIGDQLLRYDSASYFIASLDLPAIGHVVEASPDKPYVSAALTLDRGVLADLIASMPAELIGAGAGGDDGPGFAVSAVTPDLLDAWAGLLALLDRPDDIAMLAPLREREILYRLLQGPLGGQLRQIAQKDSRMSQVRRAIGWIRTHYDEAVRTATLAEIAGMSVASFHRHFKAATTMSPLQYQKILRLHAARRLLASGAEASRAAYSVGYESASQFSREYSRTFGVSPSRDAERLRGLPMSAIAV